MSRAEIPDAAPTPPAPAAGLDIRPMDPGGDPSDADLVALAACFARNGDHKDLDLLRWQYLANPVGKVYVDLAVESDTGEVGAVYATFPVEFQIGEHRVVGVQSLDTLTGERHRGKGLFTRMAAAVYARCRDEGVALVYGFPNGSSAPGFFGKLGWTRLDPVPFLFLPLRARYFLRAAGVPSRVARFVPDRVPGRPRAPVPAADEEVVTLLELGEEVDALWNKFSEHVRVAVVRDRRYLTWRLARPGGGYKVLGLRRGGELRGIAVTTCKEKHGGRVGYLMELLYVPDDHRAGEILIGHAVDDLSRSGADVVLAWSLEHAPNRTAYRRIGFRTLPEGLRPIELHFGTRALDAPPDAALGNRRNWYLSYLDSDTV